MSGLVVIVLAAGRGSRLSAAGVDGAKWLASVAQQPLAQRQVAAFQSAVPDATLLVVTGYGHDQVATWMQEQTAWTGHGHLLFNEQWAALNNWWSLLLALRHVEERAPDRNVVVVNSDLCAASDWYEPFLRSSSNLPADGAALAIDFERPLTDEAMKVSARPGSGQQPMLSQIGKRAIDAPIGEYVGMAAFGPDARRVLGAALAAFEGDPAAADEWYEGAFREMARAGHAIDLVGVPHVGWVEIDDGNDLQDAQSLLVADSSGSAA